MTYDMVNDLENMAWDAFLEVFKEAGVSSTKLGIELDRRDIFNSVNDAVMESVRDVLECEE